MDASRITALLKPKSIRLNLSSTPDPASEAVGKILNLRIRKAERDFYYEHLVEGGPSDATEGKQRQLASLLTETLSDSSFHWASDHPEPGNEDTKMVKSNYLQQVGTGAGVPQPQPVLEEYPPTLYPLLPMPLLPMPLLGTT